MKKKNLLLLLLVLMCMPLSKVYSQKVFEALLQHEVPAELHIYQRGGHGFGLYNAKTQDPGFKRCLNWMKSNNL